MDLEKFVGSLNVRIVKPLGSLLKVLLRSQRIPHDVSVTQKPNRPLIIMGNGPSLRSFIEFAEQNRNQIAGFDLEAVNFAAIAPEYFTLRPRMYVLADPHFFAPKVKDDKVEMLWDNLARTDWDMQLWLPIAQRKIVESRIAELPECVNVCWMNLTPIEGEGSLVKSMIDRRLGMPRPRNVLIAAIMTALYAGYNKVFLVGADHSWSKTLWVDDANRVVSVQPHFYKDDEKERKRVEAEYAGYHLHDILGSLTTAFRSYFDILRYADSCNVDIYNATPESFIDAFPRCDYAQMNKLSEK